MFSERAPKGIVWLATDRKVGLYFCFPSSRCVLTSEGEGLRTYCAMTSEQNVHSPCLNIASPYYGITLERRMQAQTQIWVSAETESFVICSGLQKFWESKGFILSRAKWLKSPKDQVLQCF